MLWLSDNQKVWFNFVFEWIVCQTLLYLDRGRSEFRVERERGRKFQRGFRGKDRLFTALHTDIYYTF